MLPRHPDKHQSKSRDHQERAARRFRRIREAYDVVGEDASKLRWVPVSVNK